MLKTCDCCKNSSNLKSDLDIWCDNEQEEVMVRFTIYLITNL